YYLNKQNEKLLIFNNFNIKINKGAVSAMVGPSGCGKTTLVNIIAGYIKPIMGEVLVNNKIINCPGEDRIVINQEDDLFGWMTVYENMKLVVKGDEIIEKFLNLTNLLKFKNLYPSELSGGMKKRLSFARALAVDPEFIIMDEPFGSLDYRIKQKLHEELLNIVKASNKTVLLVTHDIEEAIFLSERIIILSKELAEIRQEIIVPFDYPRKIELKDSIDFLNLKRKIKLV
ncbi:MAG: hypothetical protein AUK20_00255, partial [Parcubacteria group bacterium CG2_30_45_37]